MLTPLPNITVYYTGYRLYSHLRALQARALLRSRRATRMQEASFVQAPQWLPFLASERMPNPACCPATRAGSQGVRAEPGAAQLQAVAGPPCGGEAARCSEVGFGFLLAFVDYVLLHAVGHHAVRPHQRASAAVLLCRGDALVTRLLHLTAISYTSKPTAAAHAEGEKSGVCVSAQGVA